MIRNITLSAEESLINKARLKARKHHTSLNEVFRRWLSRYTHSSQRSYDEIMEDFSHINAGGRFSREELNER